ncbi:MAG: hypothetical protein IPL65_14285 [Lewinellaceae bacterium]|nr:hypothetical protein [Lewinellaceae bacterium]
MLVLLCNDYLAREYTMFEFSKAVSLKKKIIPLYTKQCEWAQNPQIARIHVISNEGSPIKSLKDEDIIRSFLQKEINKALEKHCNPK